MQHYDETNPTLKFVEMNPFNVVDEMLMYLNNIFYPSGEIASCVHNEAGHFAV